MHRVKLTALAVVIATAGSLLSPSAFTEAAASSRLALSTQSRIGLFAQDWNAYPADRTGRRWRAAAKHHLVLVGNPGSVYGKRIAQLHSWNRRLRVLAYDLGPYTVKGTSLYNQLMSTHPDYFARSAGGELVTVNAVSGSPAFPNNTLMDLGSRGWRAVEAKRVADAIARYGFDGAYIDSMGLGVFTGTTTAVPINRVTGLPYTQTQWLDAGARALNRVKSVIGRKFLFCNGLVNGIMYKSYTRILADSAVNGVMTDTWMRLADAPVSAYPSPREFREDLRMVRSLQAQNKYFFGWTKLWSPATDAQKRAWDRFALASYLLVKGRRALYEYSPAFDMDRTIVYERFERAKLGRPLHRYTVSNGVYRRRFQNGKVTVNPTTHRARIRITS